MFREWMKRMGYNLRQLSEAANSIGVNYDALRKRPNEQVSETELLAMAARRAGLGPWSPETDPGLVKVRRLIEVIESE